MSLPGTESVTLELEDDTAAWLEERAKELGVSVSDVVAETLKGKMAAVTPCLPERLRATLRADIQGMHAYAVQPSAGLIKLDAMENPFALPPE
jgi:hypothetical protein